MRYKQWVPVALGGLAGAVAVVVNYLQGDVVFASVLLLLFAAIGWWTWPGRTGSHRSHAAAQAAAGNEDLIVYWRPG